MKRAVYLISLIVAAATGIQARTVPLPYGNMDSWVTRNIHESRIIGGKDRQCFAIGPNRTINGAVPYENMGGSPWATSNVMAKVMGITKVSNAVFPDERAGDGRCARLTTTMEHCKAAGMVNIDVLVAGTMFLGSMREPIKNTKNPYEKLDMGIPFTRRPEALQFDYRLLIPEGVARIYSSGFGSQRTIGGRDRAEVLVLLQRRWEDADGNIHAARVATAREFLGRSTDGWVNDHSLALHYGDITAQPYYRSYMGLIPAEKSYYALNSRGKMVPVIEERWDNADATPTHLIVMFSAGSGEPYTGTPGMTLWVDNVGLQYPDSYDMAGNEL